MGAAKAGVTVVTFDEKNDIDALHQTLRDSGAHGMIFSSGTHVNEAKETRSSFL